MAVYSTSRLTWRELTHVIARDFKWALRAACLVLLVVTAISMATFWYLAIPSVILLLLCYVGLIMADGVDHWTDDHSKPASAPAVSPAAPPDAQQVSRDRRTVAIERRVGRVALEVLAGAAILAAVLALTSSVPWQILPIAALAVFGYVVLVTTPVWLAWIEDDLDEIPED